MFASLKQIHFLFKGHLDLFIHLHVLAGADGCAFVIVLLCMLILLKIFENLWCGGKCLLTKFKK